MELVFGIMELKCGVGVNDSRMTVNEKTNSFLIYVYNLHLRMVASVCDLITKLYTHKTINLIDENRPLSL